MLKQHKLKFIKAIGIFALAPIITLIIFSFIPYLGLTILGLSSKFIMWINSLALLVFVVWAPIFGSLSDKVGRKPILFSVSLVFLILGVPIFYFFEYHSAITYVCIQVFFSWVSSAYFGVAMTTNIEHLPTHLRYTGVALSFAFSYVIFGGETGLYIIKSLITRLDFGFSPILYLLFGAFIVLLCSVFLKEEASHSLEEI